MGTRKRKTPPKPKGRPPLYKPEYCQQLIEFFSIPPNRKEEMSTIKGFGKAGNQNFEKSEYKVVANPLPTFAKFAAKLDTTTVTLWEWAQKYDDFAYAYSRAKELYKEFLIENGLQGVYNPHFATFVAINTTDMKQKPERPPDDNTVEIIFFNASKNTPQLPPGQTTIPAQSVGEPVEVQVFENSQEGGEDSTSGESPNTASEPTVIEVEARPVATNTAE